MTEYLAPVINVYQPDDDGDLLVELLRDDWRMFDVMDDAHAKELLGDVLDNGDIVRQKFTSPAVARTETLSRWETLRDELMYQNRYFPQTEFDTARFEDLLSHLVAIDVTQTWYRARIKPEGEDPFPIERMGAPPKRIASHGRANPPGIPYLYLGSQVETAVSEIRPHTGEIACVADFTIASDLKFVDLRDPRRSVSPCSLGDEEAISLMRGDIAFLERLGEELTRPVLPQGAAIDYVPSQYLCEFIKKCGYSGVIYNSSVSGGINLALFNPGLANGGVVAQHQVTKVVVEVGAAA